MKILIVVDDFRHAVAMHEECRMLTPNIVAQSCSGAVVPYIMNGAVEVFFLPYERLTNAQLSGRVFDVVINDSRVNASMIRSKIFPYLKIPVAKPYSYSKESNLCYHCKKKINDNKEKVIISNNENMIEFHDSCYVEVAGPEYAVSVLRK